MAPRRYACFDAFVVDTQDRQLERTRPMPIEPLPLNLLLLLAEHSGQAVSHDEIARHLWGDKTPGEPETNIRIAIQKLRRSLGDHDDKIVVTGAKSYRLDRAVAWQETRPTEDTVPASPPPPWRPRWAWGAVIGLMASIAVARMSGGGARSLSSHEFLFGDFLRDGGCIVLSNPTVYRYLNDGETPTILGPTGKDVATVDLPAQQGPFHTVIRTHAQYTGVGEALTAVRIQSLFASAGRGQQLEIVQSRLAGDRPRHSILLGGWQSNARSMRWVSSRGPKALDDFYRSIPFRIHDGSIYRVSDGGETIAYRPELEAFENELIPIVDYALITKAKDPVDGKTLVVIAGLNSQGTEAAGWLVTEGVELLRASLVQKLPSRTSWFQVVVRVPVQREENRPGRHVEIVDALPIVS